MLIECIDIYKLNIAREYPIKTPLGTLTDARNVLIKIRTDSGLVGWGEASPFAPITGDSQESNYIAAQMLALAIKGKDPLAIEKRMAEINSLTIGEPSLRSAFDMALYDIAAKAAGMPLYQFLGGEKREIRTDMTIGMQDSVELTIGRTEQILAQGFNAIKLKVGRPGVEDVTHVRAVRECAGPDIHIKIDSNQGWDYPTALANLGAMQTLNLQYSEQPLAAWDYENLKRLRENISIPICADESVFDDKDAVKLMKQGATDYLNIKLGKSGGVHTALKINNIAEAFGCKCMIGCFAESRLGLAAAAHLAIARPNIQFLDLDSAFYFKENPVLGGMAYDKTTGGLILLPDTPGIGADIDENFLDCGSHLSI